jgi:DNA-binding XRE family transcriptional regulator
MFRMGQCGLRIMANWFGFTKVKNIESKCTLKKLRIEKGFETVTAFAKATGIHPATYSAIENHQYEANAKFKQAIATKLGMTIEEVFPERKSKVNITIIHETPNNIETMLQKQYGNKLMPRKVVMQ